MWPRRWGSTPLRPMTCSSRETLAWEASAEATVAANAAAMNSTWKNLPPTNSAISGRVSSVMLKLVTFGNTDWATWPATRKMPPPMSRVMMIALLMWDLSRASSEYMVIASKPMKEKHTTVAPVSTAGRLTPEWNSVWVLSTVPLPMPWDSCKTANPMNAMIMTMANTTRVKFTFEVEFRLHTFSPVTAATKATTQIQPGTDGNRETR